MRIAVLGAILALPYSICVAQDATAQPARPKFVSVIGTVEAVDNAGKSFTVKTDKGESATVKYDDKTSFLRVPPGEKDVKKASPINLKEVAAGDRVLARVRSGENPTENAATTFYIMTKAELAQHQEKTREEWQTRGLAGTVTSVDPAANQIKIKVTGLAGPAKEVVVDAAGKVNFRRYSGDSVKFQDARTSTLAEIQPGDHLRVLGDKSPDGNSIKAEDVVSGAFKTAAVLVKSIDAASGQITATDIKTKKPIIINTNSDTNMRKLQPMVAMMMARRMNPSFQGGGQGNGAVPGGRGPGNAAGNAQPNTGEAGVLGGSPTGPGSFGPSAPGAGPYAAGTPGAATPGGGAPGLNGPGAGAPGAGTPRAGGPGTHGMAGAPVGAPGTGPAPIQIPGSTPDAQGSLPRGGRGGQGGMGSGGPGGPGGMRMDPAKLLEAQPAIKLSDLKPGDAIVVTGSAAGDMSKLSAMTLVAGVEPILTAAPKSGADPLGGSWSFGDIGAPTQ